MSARPYIEAALEDIAGVASDGTTRQPLQFVSAGILGHFHQSGNSAMLEDAWFIPDIFASPSGIWQGLQRKGQDDVLIYSGIPTGAFASEYNIEVGGEITIPPGKVFLLFLSADYTLLKYRFECPDSSNPSFPVDYSKRFTRQLWPQHNSQHS